MERKKKLKAELENAELRAMTFGRKLNQIESILLVEKCKKTPAVFIVDKIKEVLNSDLN